MFENLLRGTALLPQLVLIHRFRRINRVLSYFLVCVGLWNFAEICTDLHQFLQLPVAERMKDHFISFLIGDALSATVLADFLYIHLSVRSAKQLLLPG